MDDSDSMRQRDSGVEMLDGKVQPASRRSSALIHDDYGQWVETPTGRRVSINQNGASSLSNSSGMLPSVETPPPVPFMTQPVNRFKTLPPLPTGGGNSGSASPDSFMACFPNGGYTADPGIVPNRPHERRTMSMASSDILNDDYAPSRRNREQSPRLAQSMYTQSGNASYASFGGDMEGGGKRGKAKGRFGLTGLLGKKNKNQRASGELSDAVGKSFPGYSFPCANGIRIFSP
jgi:hypothetical protein